MDTVNSTVKILQDVPDTPDQNECYLFYLHGLIVEEAGIRPKSEEHGYYEYERIVNSLAQEGFIVISEVRASGTQVKPYAEKVAGQIKKLLDHNIPPQQITVVGASKGGVISAYISTWLKETGINFVFLAGLFEKCLQDQDLILYGNILSVHDRSDKLSITPEMYFQRSKNLSRAKAIVLNLDVGHGLIYKPYREWIDPLIDWIKTTG
jgi:hypothetical protein